MAAGLLLVLLALDSCARGGATGVPLRPSLTIASYFPLTIAGHHFRPGENVVLRAHPRQAGLKPVYARKHVPPDGTFTLRLRGYGLDPCTGVTVTATGSKGSWAIVHSSPAGCPPVPPPQAHSTSPKSSRSSAKASPAQ